MKRTSWRDSYDTICKTSNDATLVSSLCSCVREVLALDCYWKLQPSGVNNCFPSKSLKKAFWDKLVEAFPKNDPTPTRLRFPFQTHCDVRPGHRSSVGQLIKWWWNLEAKEECFSSPLKNVCYGRSQQEMNVNKCCEEEMVLTQLK